MKRVNNVTTDKNDFLSALTEALEDRASILKSKHIEIMMESVHELTKGGEKTLDRMLLRAEILTDISSCLSRCQTADNAANKQM